MPDLPPLVALLLPALSMPLFIDLAKILGLPVALYFLALRDKRREKETAAKEKAAEGLAGERKAWREARLTSEKTLTDSIKKENTERTLWQLENAADWERVVGILKEFGEVQRQLAVVASTSSHHATEIQRLNLRLDEMTKHLNEFIMRHVKP